jgi:hypothetical protein
MVTAAGHASGRICTSAGDSSPVPEQSFYGNGPEPRARDGMRAQNRHQVTDLRITFS